MTHASYVLDRESRAVVLREIHATCLHRCWSLLAAHVRSTHVHVVVEAEVVPERVLNAFKAHASRRLNERDGGPRKRWAHHGSTRWLWKDRDVRAAIEYVI